MDATASKAREPTASKAHSAFSGFINGLNQTGIFGPFAASLPEWWTTPSERWSTIPRGIGGSMVGVGGANTGVGAVLTAPCSVPRNRRPTNNYRSP